MNEPVAQGDRSFNLQERIARLPWIWQNPKPQPLPDNPDSTWPENEIDHFILAKLKENQYFSGQSLHKLRETNTLIEHQMDV